MTNQTDICNNALAAIGTRSSISDINENSAEAAACRLQYASTLRQLLRAAHWGFAGRTVNLSLLKAMPGTPENTATWDGVWDPATMPPPPWLYSYGYPSDCIQFRCVRYAQSTDGIAIPIFSTANIVANPYSQRAAKFQIANDTNGSGAQVRIICTNQQSAIGEYTIMVDDPNVWDDSFISAMIDALGGALVPQLIGSLEKQKIQYQKANATIMEARARDGNEGLTTFDAMPDWIRARGGWPDQSFDVEAMFVSYGPLFY